MAGPAPGKTHHAVRATTVELQHLSYGEAVTVVASNVKKLKAFEKKWGLSWLTSRGVAQEARRDVAALEKALVSPLMVKSMRLAARQPRAKALTQREAAALIHRATSTWSEWERGARPLSLGDIQHFLLVTRQLDAPQR